MSEHDTDVPVSRMARPRGRPSRPKAPIPPEHIERAPSAPAGRPWSISSAAETRVLFAVANSTTRPINAGPEESAVRQALRASAHRFIIETEPDLRAEDLFGLIRRHRPDVLHFSGHGHGESGLAMKDRDNRPTAVDARELDRLCADLAIQGVHLRCVVLNACLAEDQAREVARWADFVVGTAALVGDDAAVVFSRTFYDRLAAGTAVPDAFDAAQLRCDQLGGGVFRLYRSEPAPPPPDRRLALLAGLSATVGGLVWFWVSGDAPSADPPAVEALDTGAPADASQAALDAAPATASDTDASAPDTGATKSPDLAVPKARRAPPRMVMIRSTPSGATVFDGGRPVGETPVRVRATPARRIRLELEAFDAASVHLGSGKAPGITRLRPSL